MKIELRYGHGTLPAELPDDVQATIIRKPPMLVADKPAEAVKSALQNPVGCDLLESIASGARSACIAICDITRPVPNHLLLRPLIHRLQHGGIALDRITVLVATGLHRPNEGAELQELIGDPWVLENVTVANHMARNDTDHVDLGKTPSRGTVVKLDRRFVDADVRIATGLVEPHFMAGYSGGRKVIAPGLAHAETITTFHSGRFMADPAAVSCNFEGNPLHEEQLEIIKMLGGALAVNTVIDENRQLSFVNFGEIIASHNQAVAVARQCCEVEVYDRFHTVLTSAAGYPLDKTYYQTVKGMVCAMDILEPGGDLIVVSDCSEGLGSAEYADAQKRLLALGPSQFVSSLLNKSHADIDEWQTQMQVKPMNRGNIHLVSAGLSAEDAALTGISVHRSLSKILSECLQRNPNRKIAVVPEGPYVVPLFRGSHG